MDRKGTKAAVVSMFGGGFGCGAPIFIQYKEVFLVRPFVYAIIHNETGIPVFTGILNYMDFLDEDEVKKRHDSRLEPLERLDEDTRKEFRNKFRELARRIHPDMVAPRDEAEKEQYDNLYKEALEAYLNADFSKMDEI